MQQDKPQFTRRRFLTTITSTAALAAVSLSPTPVLADRGAEQFVTKVAGQAIAAARSGSSSAFRSLVRRNSAVSSVASFALGKYRRKLPASKRAEYNRLVTKLIVDLFIQNSRSFAGQSYVVQSSSSRSNKDIVVKGHLLFAGGRAATMEWRVIRSGSRYRVFDVRVKGVWLALQMRQEFVSVLANANGDFNALMRYLKS
jgi:phospholipid transport system substrate-binding protein